MSLRKSLAAIAATAVLGAGVITATPSQAADSVTINGAGSTFIANYIEACKAGFNAATGNNVNYAGGGSGAGKTALKNGTVDFAMTDSLVAASAAPSFSWNYAPIIAGPVALAVNLPGVTNINLTADTFAKIMAGKITKWNDAAIVATNKGTDSTKTVAVVRYKMLPKKVKGKIVKKNGKTVLVKTKVVTYKTQTVQLGGIKLPDTPISVYYRTDGSGTSEVTTNYLKAANPTVWTKAGNSTFSAAFPGTLPTDGSFQGASGSDGVANGVKSKVGAITYVEMSYAKERGLGLVSIQNAAGNFVSASSAGASAFLTQFDPGSNGVIVPNYLTKDPAAYPVSAFTYAIVRTDSKLPNGSTDRAKINALKSFLTYLTTTCVPLQAEKNYYAGLPTTALQVATYGISNIG